MTDQQRLKRCERADLRILFHLPFFAPGACRLPVEFTGQFPKACTDGQKIMINPDWIDTITDEQIGTVKCHEILHPLLGHLWRIPSGGDPEVWNEACDHVVNNMLKQFSRDKTKTGAADPFPFPPGDYCCDPAFADMSEEQIYNILMARKQQGGGKQPQQGNKPGQGQAPGQGQGQAPGQQGQTPGNQPGSFGAFTIQNGKDEKGKADQNSWKHTLIQAHAAAKGRGSCPGGIDRLVETFLDPGVPWYEILNRWLKEQANDDWNFSKVNRYYSTSKFILPVLESERIGSMISAKDTSGSIDSEALRHFNGCMQTCLDDLKPSKLIEIDCDATIQEVREFRPGDTIPVTCKGGGGTDFRPVFKYVEDLPEQPKCLVYLTDLDGTFPDKAPDYPVVWVVWGDHKAPPFGEVIKI